MDKHTMTGSYVFLDLKKKKKNHSHIPISPCEQNIGSAAGAAEVSAPPSGPRLEFAAAVLLLFSASLPRWLSPHPSVAERQMG